MDLRVLNADSESSVCCDRVDICNLQFRRSLRGSLVGRRVGSERVERLERVERVEAKFLGSL